MSRTTRKMIQYNQDTKNDGLAMIPYQPRNIALIPEFVMWYKQHHFFMSSANKNKFTHSLMGNPSGVLCIPDEKFEEMFIKLACDYQKKHPQTGLPLNYPISEVVIGDSTTKLYAFIDIDTSEQEELWTEEYKIKIVKIFAQSLKEHRSNPEAKHFIYYSSKINNLNVEEKFNNFHLVTKICINIELLGWLYGTFIHKLRTQLPREEGQTPWELIVDSQVFAHNKANLRMNYASKMKDCDCHRKFTCNLCEQGKIKLPYVYILAGVFDENGEENDDEYNALSSDVIQEWKSCSIIPPQDAMLDSYFEIPSNCAPKLTGKIEGNKDTGRLNNHGNKEVDRFLKPAVPREKQKNQSFDLSPKSEQYYVLKQIIHAAKPKLWGEIEIFRISYYLNPLMNNLKEYSVLVRGKGANMCLNRCERLVQKDYLPAHSSCNCIYFIVNIRGWKQRCRAGDKLENRKFNICCSKFVSNYVPYDLEKKDILYPEEQDEIEIRKKMNNIKLSIDDYIAKSDELNNNDGDRRQDNDDPEEEEKKYVQEDQELSENKAYEETLMIPFYTIHDKGDGYDVDDERKDLFQSEPMTYREKGREIQTQLKILNSLSKCEPIHFTNQAERLLYRQKHADNQHPSNYLHSEKSEIDPLLKRIRQQILKPYDPNNDDGTRRRW